MWGLILFSICSPFVINSGSAESTMDFQLSDIECGIESFSPAIWASYTRVADLQTYDLLELDVVDEWVFTLSSGYCLLDENQLSNWANSVGATLISKAGKLEFSWILEFENNPHTAINELSNVEFIDSFYPLIEKQHDKRLVPNDPDFDEQWHLQNTGQDGGWNGEDVNITGAWDIVTGSGVTIAIVDDGLDHAHEDLSGNYLSAHSWDYCNGDSDPTPDWSGNGHGTSAAGVAAALGNNGVGVSGGALDANLVGLTLIACNKISY